MLCSRPKPVAIDADRWITPRKAGIPPARARPEEGVPCGRVVNDFPRGKPEGVAQRERSSRGAGAPGPSDVSTRSSGGGAAGTALLSGPSMTPVPSKPKPPPRRRDVERLDLASRLAATPRIYWRLVDPPTTRNDDTTSSRFE